MILFMLLPIAVAYVDEKCPNWPWLDSRLALLASARTHLNVPDVRQTVCFHFCVKVAWSGPAPGPDLARHRSSPTGMICAPTPTTAKHNALWGSGRSPVKAPRGRGGQPPRLYRKIESGSRFSKCVEGIKQSTPQARIKM